MTKLKTKQYYSEIRFIIPENKGGTNDKKSIGSPYLGQVSERRRKWATGTGSADEPVSQ